jgi:hypothetical protein
MLICVGVGRTAVGTVHRVGLERAGPELAGAVAAFLAEVSNPNRGSRMICAAISASEDLAFGGFRGDRYPGL